ncbi:Neutral ceramidase precursor [Thalassoglobus neptunius]|uniref:Neutral ceramidase n=1 Tax=Thalassoglobus neptunius TaxID=1938619 RepID=A0A5C5X3L0_9PLAN|nr:neutral/alkaline non-lysosomal ceramidase N-terminal domain-containing protein [Thalassoglobus neptunius]TWT56765.1 Neutral ceramidase precursor [Thalassoglobus neptunius]
MSRNKISPTFLVFAITFLPSLVAANDELWNCGTATVCITPQQPMTMAGYASRGEKHATDTLNDLWAKTLILEDASNRRAVLVTLDLLGIDRKLSQRICKSIMEKHGLDRSQIAICSSHTHSGPVVAGTLRPMHALHFNESNLNLTLEYSEFLKQSIEDCVDQAFETLAPSSLSWGSGSATFATNRRNNTEKNIPKLRASGKLAGPYDHDVPVLMVRQDGKMKAIVFGYACHCTVLSGFEWSGDYAGFAQSELEDLYPGCVAMFWAGCGGDQNPLPRRKVELARRYGSHLAHAVSQVIEGSTHDLSPELQTSYREVDIAFGTLPTRDELQAQSASQNRYEAARARSLIEQIDSGQELSPTYPYPIQFWNLGDEINWFFLGGEVVVDYALSIKSNHGETNADLTDVWCTAYANDVMAYIPSRRVLLEGGYEGGGAMIYYGLPTIWDETVESTILDTVHQLINER